MLHSFLAHKHCVFSIGDKKLGAPSFNPLFVPFVEFSSGDLGFNATNVSFFGVPNLKVTDLKWVKYNIKSSWNSSQLMMTMYYSYFIELHCQYSGCILHQQNHCTHFLTFVISSTTFIPMIIKENPKILLQLRKQDLVIHKIEKNCYSKAKPYICILFWTQIVKCFWEVYNKTSRKSIIN